MEYLTEEERQAFAKLEKIKQDLEKDLARYIELKALEFLEKTLCTIESMDVEFSIVHASGNPKPVLYIASVNLEIII